MSARKQEEDLPLNETQTIHDLSGDPIYARVAKKLREEILHGVFAAGERLNTAELSKRYSVSRMPIREAIQHLQGEGLIVIDPYNGPRVRNLDQKFIENTYDLQAAIESFLMGRIARTITDEQIRAAAAINRDFEKAVRQANWPRRIELNMRFHTMLYQIADNPEGLNFYIQRRDLINGLRRQLGYGTDRGMEAAEEHSQILKALAAHDGAKAEEIVRKHTEHAKEDLIDQMSAGRGLNVQRESEASHPVRAAVTFPVR